MKRICYILSIILCAANILLASCGTIHVATLEPESIGISQTGETGEIKDAPELAELPEIADEIEDIAVLELNPKFMELLQINEDIVGHIKIEGTHVDYPVVFSGDNDYYLKHDIYGEENKYGAVFMDMANRGAVLDGNTILHGHNFEGSDPLMFADIELYKNREFFDANRKIWFNNLYSDMQWEVFAVYVIPESDYYMLAQFGTHSNYLSFLDIIKSRALYYVDFEPAPDDYLLTLHTCSYEYKDAHTIVHARLINKMDNVRK